MDAGRTHCNREKSVSTHLQYSNIPLRKRSDKEEGALVDEGRTHCKKEESVFVVDSLLEFSMYVNWKKFLEERVLKICLIWVAALLGSRKEE